MASPHGEPARAAAIRAFLIADVRGYTRFTAQHGDEAASRLATKFAEVAGEGVEAWGGELVELRGDEALAVFDSPRQALRAALELQSAFADEPKAAKSAAGVSASASTPARRCRSATATAGRR
jgi:adenylate cyclase